MKISWIRAGWFVISVIISSGLAYVAFNDPLKFLPFTDLLATIISILIGLSLAISAILSTQPKLSNINYNEEEKERFRDILRKDDLKLQDGQFLLFWFYYVSLILAVVLKFMGIQWSEVDGENLCLKISSAGFVFIASLSLLWSATLPSLLKNINIQRQILG